MRLQTLVIAAAAFCLSASLASANVITQTLSVNTLTTDWSQNLTINKFNASLGTLTLVTATLSETWSGSGSIHNKASVAESGTITEKTVITASGFPLPAMNSALSNTFTQAQVISKLASGSSIAYGPYNLAATPLYSTSLASALAAFEGAGTFTFNLTTLTTQTISGGGGNISASLATDAGATLTLAYTYIPESIPVPEPGTLALLGTGLFGLGLTRYRRA